MISFLGLFFLVVMASHTFRESVSGGTAASLPAGQIHRYTDRENHRVMASYIFRESVSGGTAASLPADQNTDIQIERI